MMTILSRPTAFRLLALLPLAAPSRSAQQIVRGPFLQQGTPTSVVVRWRTDVPTDTAVKFGQNPAALDRDAKTKWKTTEHVRAVT